MCLITNQQEPLIAEQDITVYKLLDKYLSSLYCGNYFRYTYNELFETNIQESSNWSVFDAADRVAIEKHFKDFTLFNRSSENRKATLKENNFKSFGQGYHSALENDRLSPWVFYSINDRHLYRCTIPKGSKYYTNLSGLAVSNKIIINERLT